MEDEESTQEEIEAHVLDCLNAVKETIPLWAHVRPEDVKVKPVSGIFAAF